MNDRPVKCSDCGHDITAISEPHDYELRNPCPECGSKKRTAGVHVAATVHVKPSFEVRMKSALRMKKKPGKKRKPEKEHRLVYSFSHMFQKILRENRLIDRKNDKYKKTLTDEETGETVYRNEEALSKHQGRGSAKPSTKPQK